MLRITPQTSTDGSERLFLEGRLAGESVAALETSLGEALVRSASVTLDMGGVTFVDGEGARLLRDLISRDVALHGCSNFVLLLLGPSVDRAAEQR